MNIVKQLLIQSFLKILHHREVQSSLNQLVRERTLDIAINSNILSPYSNLDQDNHKNSKHRKSVFITSRFRSGSTVLWNIFRQNKHCTAYYEPFNERQWFNQSKRGKYVDKTHQGVNDYWTEFNGLDFLNEFYNEDWIHSRLLMDKSSFDPNMEKYINALMHSSNGTPVLQFNRIDFRLPWLRHRYPNAKIVHLYRHPRDQWVSFLTDKALMNKNDVQHTYQDAFYLDIWCEDLKKHFPFLNKIYTPHPYQRFYYLWKLSYLYGSNLSDISISFENLITHPENTLEHLFNVLEWPDNSWKDSLEVLKKPTINKWKHYADNEWFSSLENICEQELTTFLTKTMR